ncbi:MAG: hypothetical protein ACFE0P_13145 [Oceanicaulis sp.]
MIRTAAAALSIFALGACAQSAAPAFEARDGFRVRADFDAPLNADTGWAAAPGEAADVEADQPFRVRFLAETGPAGDGRVFALEYRRNGEAWTPVEAHDFPYPLRELELSFDTVAPGAAPESWRAQGGASLEIIEDAHGRALSLSAESAPGAALHEAPWPLEAFGVEAELRLGGAGAAGFVFGYDGDPVRVLFDPAADRIRVVRALGGTDHILAETSASLEAGAWVTAEVQREDGVLEVELADGAAALSLPAPEGLAAEPLGLFAEPNARMDVRSFALSGEPSSPRASIVAAPAYGHGEATRPLIAEDAGAGFGVSLRERTPVWRGAAARAEFEWPLVIRRFADGARVNETGDVFEFRMVDAAGAPVRVGSDPAVTLTVPAGHLGGTFVETPGRIGPFEASNGDLYVLMEPAESDNLFMVVKSEDGGRSWVEADGANRPATGDLESVDARLIDGRLYILHQITEAVLMHVFDTSEGRWMSTDEIVAEVEALSQMATLAPLSGGRFLAVFLGDRLHVVTGEPGGAWSAPQPLDPDADAVTVGPQAVRDARGAVHVAYADVDGALWHVRFGPDGTPGPRARIAEGAVTGEEEFGAVLPLAYDAARDLVLIAYRLADGGLYERRIAADGSLSAQVRITEGPVVSHAVDSQQPAADVAAAPGAFHALFVEAGSGAIYAVHECGGGWSGPVLQASGIEGSWVRGLVHDRPGGAAVYRYVYDAGSKGGAGMNRYGEVDLARLPACR